MTTVTLTKLHEEMYPDESRASLLKDAQEGHLPGAFQRKPGGMWRVDLEIHRKATRDQIEAATAVDTPEKEQSIIDDIYEEFCRAGQEDS